MATKMNALSVIFGLVYVASYIIGIFGLTKLMNVINNLEVTKDSNGNNVSYVVNQKGDKFLRTTASKDDVNWAIAACSLFLFIMCINTLYFMLNIAYGNHTVASLLFGLLPSAAAIGILSILINCMTSAQETWGEYGKQTTCKKVTQLPCSGNCLPLPPTAPIPAVNEQECFQLFDNKIYFNVNPLMQSTVAMTNSFGILVFILIITLGAVVYVRFIPDSNLRKYEELSKTKNILKQAASYIPDTILPQNIRKSL